MNSLSSLLRTMLRGQIAIEKETVAAGRIASMDEYRAACGRIDGLTKAIDLLNLAEEQMGDVPEPECDEEYESEAESEPDECESPLIQIRSAFVRPH